MALKVIHLLTRLEKIERDLSEIANLQNSLQENRDYAMRLQESLQEEQLRLRELQNRIHSQVVKDPPPELALALVGAPAGIPTARAPAPGPVPAFLEPEVILPTERPAQPPARKTPAAPTLVAGSAPTAPAATPTPPAANENASDAGDEDFSFRFIQK